jgi:hypothetical protein
MPGIGIGTWTTLAGGGGLGWQPPSMAGNALWLRADSGITLNGADVLKWDCKAGTGSYGEQLVAVEQPVFVASHANLNGYPAVHATKGVTEELDMSFDTLSAVDLTIFYVYDADGTIATDYLWDANASDRVISTHCGSATVTSDYYTVIDGWETGPAATGAAQCLAFRLESGVNGTVWRNGTSLATGTYGNTRRMAGGVLMSGKNNEKYLAEVIVYTRALAAGEMAQVFNYTSGRYAL